METSQRTFKYVKIIIILDHGLVRKKNIGDFLNPGA